MDLVHTNRSESSRESESVERPQRTLSLSRFEGDGLQFSDVDNAQRFVVRHGRDVRYCPQWKSWLKWDGMRWTRDDSGHVVELAKVTAREIRDTACKVADPDRAKTWFSFALRSQSRDRLHAMIALAQSVETIIVNADQFDYDTGLLNCLSGVIDLRTGKFGAHEREQFITKLAPVKYEPAIRPAHWLEFLDVAMAGNKRLIDYLQRCIGYSLTGRTDEAAIFCSVLAAIGTNTCDFFCFIFISAGLCSIGKS